MGKIYIILERATDYDEECYGFVDAFSPPKDHFIFGSKEEAKTAITLLNKAFSESISPFLHLHSHHLDRIVGARMVSKARSIESEVSLGVSMGDDPPRWLRRDLRNIYKRIWKRVWKLSDVYRPYMLTEVEVSCLQTYEPEKKARPIEEKRQIEL